MELDEWHLTLLVPGEQRGHHLPRKTLSPVVEIGTDPLDVAHDTVRHKRTRKTTVDRPSRGRHEPTFVDGVVDDEDREVGAETVLNVLESCSFPQAIGTARAHGLEHEAGETDDLRSVFDARQPGFRSHAFSQTEIWLWLSLVNGSRFQSLHRSRRVIPASRAMRSSSDGQT